MSLDFSIEKTCSCCGHTEYESFNITHNLGPMAEEAGVYKCLWRPEENGYETAIQIVPLLTDGIKAMLDDPEKFKMLNPSNGWGDYNGLMVAVGKILLECKKNPTYLIKACR